MDTTAIKRTTAVMLLFAALAGAHCASGPPAAGTEKALRERVTQYWEARSETNLAAAYGYYEPEFREKYSQELFLSNFQRLLRFRPQFRGIESVQIQADGRTATVRVGLRTMPPELNGEVLDSINEETWLLIEGVWYRQREAMLPTI
jgi:hypothetical protein